MFESMNVDTIAALTLTEVCIDVSPKLLFDPFAVGLCELALARIKTSNSKKGTAVQVNKCQCVGLITLLISASSWYGTAEAGTLLVCATCNHTTIQRAVNDAADNDEINIAAGRYIENITISGKSLTLLGAANVNGSGETLVLAAGRGPVFTLGSGVAGDIARAVLLDGMIISGGNHNGGTAVGGGVQVRSGSYLPAPGPQGKGSAGGGVFVGSGSSLPSTRPRSREISATPTIVAVANEKRMAAGNPLPRFGLRTAGDR
jgi:hypothetical protein